MSSGDPRTTVLEAAFLPVASHVQELPPTVLTPKAMLGLVRQQMPTWASEPGSTIPANALLELLREKQLIQKIVLRSPDYASITRYALGDVAPLAIARSLRPKGYMSHGAAVFIHGLNDEIPRTFYVNVEQSQKPSPHGDLTQDGLARAFTRPQRASRYIFAHDKVRYVILSGKHTDNFGVIEVAGPDRAALRTTDLERTLVDIVVRPSYAGGIYPVRKAFEAARGRVSVHHLVTTLQALNHVYPYHQALGFLLERAGIPPSELAPLRDLGFDFDFYLTHGMKNPVLDRSWRIYHPKGF